MKWVYLRGGIEEIRCFLLFFFGLFFFAGVYTNCPSFLFGAQWSSGHIILFIQSDQFWERIGIFPLIFKQGPDINSGGNGCRVLKCTKLLASSLGCLPVNFALNFTIVSPGLFCFLFLVSKDVQESIHVFFSCSLLSGNLEHNKLRSGSLVHQDFFSKNVDHLISFFILMGFF